MTIKKKPAQQFKQTKKQKKMHHYVAYVLQEVLFLN